MGWYGEGLLGSRQVLRGAGIGVTAIAVLAAHDALEGSLCGDGTVQEELRRVDPQGVSRNSGESLDVELGTEGRVEVHLDAADSCGLEDKDIGSRRIPELVGHAVDKDLVTSLDIAMGDRLPRLIDSARTHSEIPRHDIAGCEDRELPLCRDHFCEGEEVEFGVLVESQDFLFCCCLEVEMGAPEADEIHGTVHRSRQGICRRMSQHPVESRLHRSRGYLEWLQEVGLESYGQGDGDHDSLDILSPDGVGSGGNDGGKTGFKGAGYLINLLLFRSADCAIQ